MTSRRVYALVCSCGRDFIGQAAHVTRCPICAAEWAAEHEEQHPRHKIYARRKDIARRSGNATYQLITDPSPWPCLPGMPLICIEVNDAEAWQDGTQFLRVQDKRVFEWRDQQLVEVRA